MEKTIGPFIVPALLLLIFVFKIVQGQRVRRRRAFIESYDWPPGLMEKLRRRHDWRTDAEAARVALGLRQFFRAYLQSGRKYVAMPSQVVDDLWHEFILYTRAYEDFCQNAFGGFLHHTPALALRRDQRQSNAGLRRVWLWSCKGEGIDPAKPSRLPLLFALDAELSIANGFHYSTDCKALRESGVASSYCGGDFTDSSFDGSTDGLHDSGAGHSSHDSGGHGHGDSGGHGGGHGCGGHSCGGGSCGGGGD